MEKLGLDITRQYKDFNSFNSREVRCLGLIKDLCVTLAQIPTKIIVMDIVVADIPPKVWHDAGMLMGRKITRNPSNGHDLCHYTSVWSTKKTV